MDLLAGYLSTLSHQFHRLILVVGAHGSGKTFLLRTVCEQRGIPILNVNLQLSQCLLEFTSKQRPLRVRPLLADIINHQPASTIALDNIELLFEPSLQQDPLALLKEMSRNKSLIVAWPGSFDNVQQLLVYAEPGHAEYRRYERPEVLIVTL